MKLFCPLWITLSCAAIAWPQAVVESSAVTAATSSGAAAASSAGKSIGSVFGSLSKTLDKAGKSSNTAVPASKPAATVSTPSSQVTTQPAAPPAAKLADPTQAMIGLDVDELIQRCGEPSMSTSQVRDSQSVETFWYYGAHHDVFEVTLRDGIVSSVKAKVSQAREKDPVAFK